MRQQLTRYVDLLFAGASGAEDIKDEILQNTLDRYDDLVSQGKSPEAAYRLAISGIGDINEILGEPHFTEPAAAKPVHAAPAEPAAWKKILKAAAIAMYIISPIPLFILSEIGLDTLGLCGTIGIVAVATILLMLSGSKKETNDTAEEARSTPQKELRKSIEALIGAVGLIVYLVLSFATNAWFITWLIFPIIGAVQGLVFACMDLKEAQCHEN